MLCAYCGKDIEKKLPQHLKVAHGQSIRNNTILINHLDPKNLPKCPYCGMDVMIDRIVHPTCEMPACIERRKAENRHNGQVLENRRRVEAGTSNFLKKNLQYDEQGRSLIHLNSYRSRMINGNLYPNISILETRVYKMVKNLYPQATSQYGIPQSPDSHPYDIYVPDLKLLIEIDGNYWHETEEDRRWDALANQFGYDVERISWDENQAISDEELLQLVRTILDRHVPNKEATTQHFSRHSVIHKESHYFPASAPQSMWDEEFSN